MAKMIDIEFIQKWVDISEEELMQRLVKDAVELQKEAEENYRKTKIAERKTDNEYNIEFVKQFYGQYDYLKQFFTDEEILSAVKNHMGKSDLAREQFCVGAGDNLSWGRFVKYDRQKVTVYKGSWQREEIKDGAVYLMPHQYQNVCGSDEVLRELLETKCPWVKNYDIEIYGDLTSNDWIYLTIPDGIVKKTYASDSLYVPYSAIITHDAEKITEIHKKYWNSYGLGKYDDAVDKLLKTEFVKEFLHKVAEE